MKVIIYGAGNYCQKFIELDTKDLKKTYDVLFIVDNDSKKWGNRIFSYLICPPDEIHRVDCDGIVIAVRQYEQIVDDLFKKNIPFNMIYLFYPDKNTLIRLSDKYKDRKEWIDAKLFYQFAKSTLQEDLLLECLRDDEFDGFNRIVVVGSQNEYQIVNDFFLKVDSTIQVIKEENAKEYFLTDKFVLAGKDYKMDLLRIESKIFDSEQWVIIPIFDVSNMIYDIM